jgi:hypothetical protein
MQYLGIDWYCEDFVVFGAGRPSQVSREGQWHAVIRMTHG